MQPKLSHWANIAEILSGIAVVVTLIFLIRGVNENSEITRAAMYANHVGAFNEQSRDFYSDPELARIFSAWLAEDVSSLDESDMQRLDQIAAYIFRTYETAFLAYEAGIYGEVEWERMERASCANYGRAKAAGFTPLLEALMTRPFLEFLNDNCP